jgi:FMN phosphatase YigB (HAD superfamily)
VEGVLFDFHETLFRFERDEEWIRTCAEACALPLGSLDVPAMAARIDEARGLPEVLAMGEGRDLSSAAHRRATTGWLRLAGVPEPLVEVLYERLVTPVCWHPYPDCEPVLRTLVERGIAVGVVSNIGWDLRETFEWHGLRKYVSTFALSCELGLEKPGNEIFWAACAALGTRPRATLVVGDNPATDGGCVNAGLAAYLMPSAQFGQARGLSAVLRLAGADGPVDAPGRETGKGL